YRGTLTDGTQFDSSYDRGEPSTFSVSGVIPGFGEALQLMSVGSQIRVTIPPDLAYGDRSVGDVITPNSTLVFEIELLELEGG
ncbi:MAG: FKBP-type peptidyl-prolyl cis-trans isomerase, partial [Gemmatimonadota bacterium]|nr:FKBP-type peptidyl-prolyl cis-trans isomerase [Gemmatimonadota bacterium]